MDDRVAAACIQGLGAWDGPSALGRCVFPRSSSTPTRSMNEPETLSDLWTTLVNAHTPGVVHFNQLLAAGEVNRLIEDFVALAAPAG